jgi:hypothetical protein
VRVRAGKPGIYLILGTLTTRAALLLSSGVVDGEETGVDGFDVFADFDGAVEVVAFAGAFRLRTQNRMFELGFGSLGIGNQLRVERGVEFGRDTLYHAQSDELALLMSSVPITENINTEGKVSEPKGLPPAWDVDG